MYAFEQKDMALEEGIVTAWVKHIELTGDEHDWHKVVSTEEVRLSALDAIIERKDPPFDMEYVYGTYLLELAEKQGACVFNKPSAIRDNNEKLAIAQFSEFTSPTLVTSDEARLRAFHAKHQDVIFKPLDGMGGTGIFRVKADGLNLGAIIETLSENGAQTIMAQRLLPTSSRATSASSSSAASRCRFRWRASRRRAKCAATWPPAARAWRSH